MDDAAFDRLTRSLISRRAGFFALAGAVGAGLAGSATELVDARGNKKKPKNCTTWNTRTPCPIPAPYRAGKMLSVPGTFDLARDGAGMLYDTDERYLCARQLDPAGHVTRTYGACAHEVQGCYSYGLTIDAQRVYVLLNDRLVSYFRNAMFDQEISTNPGSDPGQLTGSREVYLSPVDQKLYVADTSNNRIQIFSSGANARFLNMFSTSENLTYPEGVSVDQYGNVYVSVAAQHCVLKFGPSGVVLKTFGVRNQEGADKNHLSYPRRVRFFPNGDLLIIHQWGARWVSATGQYRGDFTSFSSGKKQKLKSIQFSEAVIDANSNIYFASASRGIYPFLRGGAARPGRRRTRNVAIDPAESRGRFPASTYRGLAGHGPVFGTRSASVKAPGVSPRQRRTSASSFPLFPRAGQRVGQRQAPKRDQSGACRGF